MSGIQIHEWEGLTGDQRSELLKRPSVASSEQITQDVLGILQKVREGGDQALRDLTLKFDGVQIDQLGVPVLSPNDIGQQLEPEARKALDLAFSHIKRFHALGKPKGYETEVAPGIRCEMKCRPMDSVGLYIPGGTAPLPSTMLMLGVPALIAGCPLKVVVTPPQKDGGVHPAILYAASLCGVDKIFLVGGAHGIAALAYGTESVPKVAKIFGPGNAYVTAAKQLVSMDALGAAIDMPAGPSEVLVIADESASPDFVAADLLSQAEHGPDSQSVLLSTSDRVLTETMGRLVEQLLELPRADICRQSLRHLRLIKVKDMEQALEVANLYASEHLILQVNHPEHWVDDIQNAGSVFLGHYSPEAVGDYASGTNHVLPTYGHARAYSGLSVKDFTKFMSFQSLSPEGLQYLGPAVETLADLEGLSAHKLAVSLRLKSLESNP